MYVWESSPYIYLYITIIHNNHEAGNFKFSHKINHNNSQPMTQMIRFQNNKKHWHIHISCTLFWFQSLKTNTTIVGNHQKQATLMQTYKMLTILILSPKTNQNWTKPKMLAPTNWCKQSCYLHQLQHSTNTDVQSYNFHSTLHYRVHSTCHRQLRNLI